MALLANCNPLGCIFSAVFLSFLRLGGNAMQSQGYATEATDIVISVIVYLAAFALLIRMILSGGWGRRGKKNRKKGGAGKMSTGTWASIINLTICFAIPLMLVALGGMYSERSGVINLALEGIMIMGALASTLVLQAMDAAGWGEQVFTSQLGVALAALIAGLAGMIFSLLLAFAAINLKADQTIGGTALNLFAPAFCVVVAWAVQGQGITDIAIPSWTRWTPSSCISQERSIRISSRLCLRVLHHHSHCSGAVPDRLVRPVQDPLRPAYARLRRASPGGGFCGHKCLQDAVRRRDDLRLPGRNRRPGVCLVTGTSFAADVGGYGFLALAVMIFGNWKPLQIFFCSIFFALFKVVGTYYTLIPILPNFKGVEKVSNIYNLLPYVVTMIVLIATSKSSQAPKAEGIPYDKGSR